MEAAAYSDWPLWAALILPMASCLTYIPLLQNAGQAVFEPVFARFCSGNAVWFYVQNVLPNCSSSDRRRDHRDRYCRMAAALPQRDLRSDTVEAAAGMAAHDLTFLVFRSSVPGAVEHRHSLHAYCIL